MISRTEQARELLRPIGEWSVAILREAFERAASLGRLTERRVLDAARSMEVPATRVENLASLPIETRDEIAKRITLGHASLAAVSCGAAGAFPIAGMVIELAALAELNMVQVDHIARAYGFDVGGTGNGLATRLPLGGSRMVLLVPILAALNVKALDRDGKMESIGGMIAATAQRREWQAIGARLASAAALGLLKRAATRPLRRLVPMWGGAISAWSSYRFTEAVGEEARRYFRDLATGEVTVRGKVHG